MRDSAYRTAVLLCLKFVTHNQTSHPEWGCETYIQSTIPFAVCCLSSIERRTLNVCGAASKCEVLPCLGVRT